MTQKTLHLLSEGNIYISWGILILAISITWMASQTMAKVDQMYPVINQVQGLKDDISLMKQKLQMYDIEIRN